MQSTTLIGFCRIWQARLFPDPASTASGVSPTGSGSAHHLEVLAARREHATVVRRLGTLGPERLGDVALDLEAPALAAWLANPRAR